MTFLGLSRRGPKCLYVESRVSIVFRTKVWVSIPPIRP